MLAIGGAHDGKDGYRIRGFSSEAGETNRYALVSETMPEAEAERVASEKFFGGRKAKLTDRPWRTGEV